MQWLTWPEVYFKIYNSNIQDLTKIIGVHESFKLRDNDQTEGSKKIEKNELWEVILQSFCLKSLCSASIKIENNSKDTVLSGLTLGKLYLLF